MLKLTIMILLMFIYSTWNLGIFNIDTMYFNANRDFYLKSEIFLFAISMLIMFLIN